MSSEPTDFYIKNGYKHNLDANPYGCTEEDSIIYQRDVYRYAANLIEQHNLKSVLDLGCGHGMKLKEFIQPITKDITGIDWESSITFCKENHQFGNWYIDNIEEPSLCLDKQFDLIVCADVIEHLFNPDLLFKYFTKFSHKKTYIVISTPERDLRRGHKSMGPPKNPAHVREWNESELNKYIKSQNFKIIEHTIVDLKKGMKTCQLVNCHIPS